jgi:hypothetical protein
MLGHSGRENLGHVILKYCQVSIGPFWYDNNGPNQCVIGTTPPLGYVAFKCNQLVGGWLQVQYDESALYRYRLVRGVSKPVNWCTNPPYHKRYCWCTNV